MRVLTVACVVIRFNKLSANTGLKSQDFGCSICRERACHTGIFLCVCVFVLRSDSYSNTHIWAKCNSSKWNVLTTRRPRIALVDNRRTHTHTSLFACTAHQSSINTDYSDIDLFFATFITPPSFWGCLDLHMRGFTGSQNAHSAAGSGTPTSSRWSGRIHVNMF